MTRGGGGVTSLGQSPKKYQQSYSGGDTIPTVNPIPSHTFIIASSGRSTYHHVMLISRDSFKGAFKDVSGQRCPFLLDTQS